MHLFDSPTYQRQGSGTRLQTVYGLLATILVLLTVGTSTGWAQAPTLATQAASAIICAGNSPTFDLFGDAPPTITYNVANPVFAVNGAAGEDITANFGDETVYHLPGADINGLVGGAFNFTFFGTTHDLSQEGIYIGSNGFLRFENFDPNDNIEANQFGINAQFIPAAGGPNDAIYFLNNDLFPQAGELIEWGYDAVNDAFVVEFTAVSQFNVNNPGVYPYAPVTVEVVLWSDASANPGLIEVNLTDWADPVYIPNAHTIGVENACGTVAFAAGAPGAHNQSNWANAQGVGNGTGVANTSWTFTPVAGAAQVYSARLVRDDGDGIRETFDLNGPAQGGETYASAETGGSPVSLTGDVMNTPGTYMFYAIVEYANCHQAQTDLPMSQVVVDPQPTVQTIGPAAANYCEGPTYNFTTVPTVAGSNFTWAMGAPMVLGVDYTVVTSGLNNRDAAFTFLTAGAAGSFAGTARTINATETGPGPEFCAITSTKNITVYTTPAGTVSTTSPTYCGPANGSTLFVDFASFSGAPAQTYAWTLTNTGTTGASLQATGAQASPDLTLFNYYQPNAPQLVTLNLTATNGPAGLCSFTTSTTFTVNPMPTAKTFTQSPLTNCTNVATTYTLGSTLAGNTYGYSFTGAGNFTGPDAAYISNTPVLGKSSVQITWSAAGAASVTAIETTPQGCQRTQTTGVFTVSATPSPTILGSNVPCQFLASAVGPPAFQTNPTPQQYTYTLAAPNLANGYRWSVPTGGTIVAVNGTPCSPCANPTPSAGGFTVSGSAPSITVQWTGVGAHTVVVTEQGVAPNSCQGTTTYNVTVSASPAAGDFSISGPGIMGANPPCQNQPTTATAYTVTGAGQHNIQLNGGTAAAAAPYAISGGGDVISGAGPGTFGSVTWTALSGTIIHDYAAILGGCTSRETYTVTIQPLPVVTITGLTDVCGNSTGLYTASNPSAGITSYAWGWTDAVGTFPFVGAPGGTIASPAASSTNVTFFNAPGTFYLGVRVVGPIPSGCAEEYVLGINVTPQPTTPILAGFAPTTVCDSVVVPYTVTGTVGNQIRLTVVGGVFTAPSAGTSIAFAATGGADPFSVQWINSANGGTGYVTAIQYTTGVPSCTSLVATSPTITIVRQPNATVAGPSPVCGNDQNVVYTASNPQFINTYLWGWSNDAAGTGFPAGPAAGPFDGPTTASTVTVDMLNVPGTYFLAVQVVNTTGGANCTKIFTKTIVLNAQPAQPVLTDNFPATIPCDSSLTAGPKYTVNGSGTAGSQIRITITGGKYNSAAGPTTIVIPAAAVTNFDVFWGFGGAGGVGTISAFEYSNAVPACTSTVAMINQTVNPLPPYPTVTITPDPPGYCTDAVPVNFLINNVAAYVGAANSFTATWQWPSPAGGTTPAGFAGAANDPDVLNSVTNEQYTVTNWTATPTVGFTTTFRVTVTDNTTLCGRFNDYTVVVQPRPAPVISGPNGVPTPLCQQPTDPAGSPANTVYVNPRYVYSTPQVAGNYYNWSITDGYIVAYSVTGPGGPWIQTAASSTMPGGSPILNASAVQVVFYGINPASVKVAELTAPTSPPGCQTTTPDYAVQIDPLTPYILVDNNAPNPYCFNDPLDIDQDGSDVGHTYQLQVSTNAGVSFANVTNATPTPSQAGTGAALNWSVPTGTTTQINAPGFYDFRSVATSPAGCLSYTGTVTIEVVPNPDTIPMSPLTDTICDTSPGIPFVIGPTVESFVIYDLEREGPATVWTSYDTYLSFAPPATITLTDNSNPPGAAAPAGIDYNYRVVALNIFTGCSTVLDTAVIRVVDPCTPIIGAVNTPPGYNDDEVCIYGGYEEHLRTYKLATTPCFINTPGVVLNWFTMTPPGSLVTGAVREQGGDTAVVEWYTTGGTQYGWIIAEITLPASFGGCVAYDTMQVRVYPLPVPVIGTGPAAVCQNQQDVQYSATLEAGDTYMWEVVGGLIDQPVGATGAGTTLSPSTYTGLNANVIRIDWLDVANPTATITLTQTTPVGCLARVTRTITVNPTPTPSINGPIAPCGLDVVTYTTQNNAPNNSYQWSVQSGPGTIQSGATTNSIQFLTGAAGSSTVLRVTETIIATNCSKFNDLTINPVLKPTPVITRVTPMPGNVGNACINTPMTYSIPTVVGNSRLWSIVGGTITSATNANPVSVTWNVLGTQSLTVAEWVNTAQCTTTVTQQVVVEAIPAPSITGPVLACGSTSSNYSTPLVAGHTYVWSLTNPAHGNFVGSTTSNSSTILWNNPAAGSTFAAQVNVTETATLAGCSGSALLGVTIHRQPTVPVITRTTPAGNANQACTSDQINYAVTNNAGSTFLWNVTGGNILSGQGTSTTLIEWTAAGAGTVTLTETTTANTACFATGTLNVTVEQKPTPSVTGPTLVCGNAISTYSTPAVAGDTYLWTITAGTGTITSSATTNSINVTWGNPTPGNTFTSTVTVVQTTNTGNCTGTASATVTIHRQPTVPVITRTTPAGNANQACTSDQINYAVTNNAGSTYLWNVTGGNILSGQGTSTTLIEWTAAGAGSVMLTETTTANTACFATGTLNVTVEDKPTPTVTGPTVVCGNAISTYSTPAVAGTTYLWTIGNAAHGTITSSATTNSINITWNNPAAGSTFTATVTVVQTTGTGNCTGTASATVTVHRQPTVPVITRTTPVGNANQACTSDQINYAVTNNAGSTYLWNVTGGNILSGQGTSTTLVEWTVAGNNTVTLTESTTANTACTATATLNVAVENKPTPTVSGPAVVCGNVTSNYSTPAVAGDTYAWVIGNAAHGTITSSTTTNAITVIWNNPAAGSTFAANLAVTQTTPSGNCTGTANINVTVHRQPTVPVISRVSPAGNANQACTSDNITYSVPNNAGSTYLWNVVGGNIVSGQGTSSVVILWTVAGNNTVTLTETTTANTACTATGTLNVAVEADPVPTVTGPAVVCGNQTATYSTPAVAGNTYAWTIGNAAHGTITSSTTTNSITILWNNPAAGTTFGALVTVTQATASGNCTSTANINVTVHRQPTVPVISRVSPAGNANQACTSDNITYSVPNNAGSTYVWNVTGGNIVSGQNTSSVVIQWTVAGNNTLTVTETTAANTACVATGTLNVAVEADPVPTVTGPAVVCGNQTATYSTPAVAGNTYAWTMTPANGTITSSTTTNSITILWNNPAVNTTNTTTVTVTQATASGNCTSTASITVTTHRQPTPPVITRVSPAGNANQACTSDNITYSVPNNLGSTFVWNVSGGNIQSGQNTNQIVVEWTLAGAGSVTVTETTQGNTLCTATSTMNVAVENKPTPTVTGPAVVCGNATSNYSTPAVAGDTYLWSIANAAHGTITSSMTTNAITVMWNNPAAGTTFPATVTVTQTTPSGNCTGTASISVTVHRQPTTSTITRVTAGGLVNEACTGQTIQYSIPNNAGSSYNWTVTGANVNSGQGTNAITVTWNVAGTGTLTVVESTTANTACFATSTQSVTVEATPTPAITGPSIACGNSTSTFSTPNVPGNSYAWTLNNAAFGTFTSATNTNSANILWNNPAPGATFAAVVTVTETTPTGNCVTSTTRNVTIHRQPIVQTITRVSPAGNPNQACSGDNITYSVVNNAGSTYVWNVVGGNIISGQSTTTLVVEWTQVGNGSVSVTETNSANTACAATSTLNVTVEAKPNPSITGPAVVCGNVTTNYSTPAVAGNTYMWSINAALPPHGTITSSTTTNAITVIWNNPAPNTTFTAVLNVTESTPTGNCVTTTSLTVTVHRQPTPPTIVRVSPAGNPNQACQGDNITYSVTNNAGSTYQWTVTGGNIIGTSTTNSVVVEWTVAGNGSLTVVETTATNTACSATATLLVGIEAKPNPVITGATVVCGNSVQNYSTPSAAGNTYLWTIGNAAHGTITSSATSNAIQITWNNPTPGTTFPASVTVTETSPSGNCTGTATVAVTVHRQPVANPITRVSPAGNANQACSGDNITYAVTNNAGSSYNWTVTGGNLLSGQATNSVVIEWTVVGNQTLTSTETTTALAMCSFTNTLSVSVEAKPTPIISGPTVVCINTIHTHSTPFVAGNTYSWSITPDAGAPVPVFAPINGWNTSNSVTLQWIQTGLHTLSVTETSNSGNCVGTTSIQVRVNPIPTPAITSTTGYGTPTTARPGVVCAGSTHTYSVTPTPGNVFFWTVSGGSIISGQNTPNLTVTWGSAGMGTIGITETIPGSTCMGTDLDTIDKRAVPTPLITGNINPCANATTIYTTPFVTGNTYTWTVNGPAGTTFFVVPGTPNSISVTWGSLVFPATFSGSVSVTESVAAVLPAGSCLSSNTLNLTVRPNPPAVTITASQNPVCASDLNDVPPTVNNVTYTTPAVAGVTYTWSITSNGTIVSGQGSNAVVARWTNPTTVPTTGTITAVLTTPFGCTSTGSFVATINPLPNPVISGPTAVCQNTIHNYSSAGIPGNSYTWTLSGGNIIRTGQGTPNITVEWTLPGSHTLTLTETTIATGCTAMNTITVTVNPIPTAQITASGPTTFCQGGDVTLTAPLGFASYIWNTGQTGRSIVVRTTGTYYVLVTDVNGCSNTSDTITVNVFPTTLPIITTSGPTTFCEGGSITLTAPSGFTAYLWSTGATTQSIQVTQSGTYTVTVADNNGCTGTSTEVDVFVNPRPTPVLTVIGTTTICNGDSVEVRAPAGYPSYTWVSTSGTNYGTGRTIFIRTSDTVYVTVSDVNGCPGTSDIVRVVLSSVTAPTVTASGVTQFCQGGSVTLSAPTGFANYIWSNGSTNREVTVTESGTYTVTVTDNSLCAATSATTTVTVFPTPAKPTIDRTGDELVASGPATTYQWYRNGTMLPGATNDTLTGTAAGAYRVEIADANGCTNLSDPFDFITTGVDDVTAGYVAEMRVFPNPTNGQFTIETEISQAGPVRIQIVNSIGELVLTLNATTDGGRFQATNHLGDLASGVYSVILTSGNERWTVRLVRQ